LFLCGITGYPPNDRIAKTALGAHENVVWEYRDSISAVIKELKAAGYQIVLLEQMEGSRSYRDFIPDRPVCLVVGNEIEGITQDILPECDLAVDIEMAGIKNSLNVAVAFGIMAYHIRGCLRAKAF